jgi:hypothetical protein
MLIASIDPSKNKNKLPCRSINAIMWGTFEEGIGVSRDIHGLTKEAGDHTGGPLERPFPAST